MYGLIRESDVNCINDLCMDRRTFSILCKMPRDIDRLSGTRNTSLRERERERESNSIFTHSSSSCEE